MYHKRPLGAQNAQPIPMPEGGRRRRKPAGYRRAWGSRGHFGGRSYLTGGATTNRSLDASLYMIFIAQIPCVVKHL